MTKKDIQSDAKLSFSDHLDELRLRLLKSIIFIFICICLSFMFVDKLLIFLIRPVGQLIFTAPAEAFIVRLKIVFFSGLMISSPFIVIELWRFIATGLHEQEKKYIRIFGPLSFLLFCGGASFGYSVIIPVSLKFLLGFANEWLVPMITASQYISFIGTLTLSFGIIFELPLAILFLTMMGLLTPQRLKESRKYAIVSIFILAAFLTPPDVMTQVLMALPLLGLYEISVIFSQWAFSRIKRKENGDHLCIK